MYCSKCGKEVSDEAVVCVHCGCMIRKEKIYDDRVFERKINILCLIGFILTMVSLLIALWGIVAIVGMVLCGIGVSQASRNEDRLKGLGVAGLIVGGISLLYTLMVISGCLFYLL